MLEHVYEAEWDACIAGVDLTAVDQLTEALGRLRGSLLGRVEMGIAANFVLRKEGRAPVQTRAARTFMVTAISGLSVRASPDQLSAIVGGLHVGAIFDTGLWA